MYLGKPRNGNCFLDIFRADYIYIGKFRANKFRYIQSRLDIFR
jgi:hypothetical protein